LPFTHTKKNLWEKHLKNSLKSLNSYK
jgi:hypothetical protein